MKKMLNLRTEFFGALVAATALTSIANAQYTEFTPPKAEIVDISRPGPLSATKKSGASNGHPKNDLLSQYEQSINDADDELRTLSSEMEDLKRNLSHLDTASIRDYEKVKATFFRGLTEKGLKIQSDFDAALASFVANANAKVVEMQTKITKELSVIEGMRKSSNEYERLGMRKKFAQELESMRVQLKASSLGDLHHVVTRLFGENYVKDSSVKMRISKASYEMYLKYNMEYRVGTDDQGYFATQQMSRSIASKSYRECDTVDCMNLIQARAESYFKFLAEVGELEVSLFGKKQPLKKFYGRSSYRWKLKEAPGEFRSEREALILSKHKQAVILQNAETPKP